MLQYVPPRILTMPWPTASRHEVPHCDPRLCVSSHNGTAILLTYNRTELAPFAYARSTRSRPLVEPPAVMTSDAFDTVPIVKLSSWMMSNLFITVVLRTAYVAIEQSERNRCCIQYRPVSYFQSWKWCSNREKFSTKFGDWLGFTE